MTTGSQSDSCSGRSSWRESGLWVAAGLLVLTLHAVAAGLLADVYPQQQAAGARYKALLFELDPLPGPSPEATATEAAETLRPQPEPQAAETADAPETETPVEPPIPAEPAAAMSAETVEQAADEASGSLVKLPPHVRIPEPRPAAGPSMKKSAARKSEKPTVEKAVTKPPKPAPPGAKPKAKSKAASANPSPSRASESRGAQSAPHVSPAKWQSKVLAWLNRHKRYPAAARARKASGSAQVGFSIDASGRVISTRVTRSSGDADLDREALETIRRSSPVPAPPSEIAKPRMSLTVPVVFDLY